MNNLLMSLILDCIMAALLVATIVICFRLNKRVRILQDSKSEFSQLIQRFDDTTKRAQQSVQELQNVGKQVHDKLSERLDKANFLADDLAFMIEKGNKIADQMEGSLSSRRVDTSLASRAAPQKPVISPREAADPVEPAEGEISETRRGLDAVLNKMSGIKDAAKGRKSGVTARLRSQSEQELYDAIKSGKS
jgi:methyl-accepting chemotaxis protein